MRRQKRQKENKVYEESTIREYLSDKARRRETEDEN
jgi:hypothetical protein